MCVCACAGRWATLEPEPEPELEEAAALQVALCLRALIAFHRSIISMGERESGARCAIVSLWAA